jgi:hypothetical protein
MAMTVHYAPDTSIPVTRISAALRFVISERGERKGKVREEGLQLTSHAITAHRKLSINFLGVSGPLGRKAGLLTEFL